MHSDCDPITGTHSPLAHFVKLNKFHILFDTQLWHYRLWSFKTKDIKLERFLHKNQHIQRKLLNFENWTNGKPQ